MQKTLITLMIVSLAVGLGCSKRRTRQFIVPEAATDGFTAGEWVLEAPSVVAFKDVIKLDDIQDTTMFWVSLRAHRPRPNNSTSDIDLNIDSVSVTFLPENIVYWRTPTRASQYGRPDDKEIKKLFDFFGDQGIVIPEGVDTILLGFDAVAVDGQNSSTYAMAFKMVREEQTLKVPLLQQ